MGVIGFCTKGSICSSHWRPAGPQSLLMVVEIMLSEQKKDRFLSIAQKPFKHQISPQAQKYGAGRL